MRSDARSRWTEPLYALVLLAATGLALVGAAAVDERPAGPTQAAEPDLGDPVALAELGLELAPQVAGRVEEMRGLRFDDVPLPRVVDGEFLNELTESEFRRREGDPARAFAADEAVGRIVGLLDAGDDLASLVGSTGDLAAAAWDTRDDRLYVISDAVARSPALLELFLAHELTHALEDQRFGLPDLEGVTDDRALAQVALTEGTATALMAEYAARHLDPLALGAATLGLDDGTADVPDFVVEQIEWAYLGGGAFVERLHDLGGGWDLIDHALEHRPPASTSQVLHPLKYVRDERPLAVEIDDAPLRSRGWKRADVGTLGELATRQLLSVGDTSRRAANRAAAGWGGDRYELWSREVAPEDCAHPCRENLALVLRWRWDTAADAAQFAEVARRYVADGLGGQATGAGAWALDGGWAALDRSPVTTTLAFAPGEALARAVAGD